MHLGWITDSGGPAQSTGFLCLALGAIGAAEPPGVLSMKTGGLDW